MIHQRLREHVESEAGPADREAFVAFLKDTNGSILGGIRGYSHWKWLYISHFWVDPNSRSMGLGSELLQIVETEALKRGCRGVYVDTFDRRARNLYVKNGFQEFGSLVDFPPGSTRFFLQKRIL